MKNLELLITKAWQDNSPMLTTLAPLSALYGVVGRVRKSLYDNDKLAKYYAPIPVMIIGNITVGGSGKTPLIIALVKYLQDKGINVGVISRGYGRADSSPAMVFADSTPKDVGDEPCLIVQSTNVPMAVGANRGQVIDLLIKNNPTLQLIISDDGLQHYALHRDVEWIVVDGVRGFGNGKLFPQGFLREPLDRLNGATVIYHDSRTERYDDSALLMHLAPSKIIPLFHDKSDKNHILAPQKVYAVSGIGYPARFFKTLTELGFDVMEKPFGDHHEFVLDDLMDLKDLPIITTSKDAVKLRELAKQHNHTIFDNVWVLPVQAVLSESVYGEMDRVLNELGIDKL
ncbi:MULTISPECIES: tetraacyldisaccharide 4'-kinase [Moraxella]|uniref:Tetraacyldisaccharide 4'-kinase n=2 Tax=Moraxella lacunata TaxID=477 RepID=A0A1B8Q5L5_MORLA|nr:MULTISPECIES: tetraacyldisaccharide 4'-kinase [Moraxella]MBE9577646.1 tetraacyldisaccharide 4'-kinase [Moraxella sp. K1664]MBE9587096.1 tetraacyldisaccharide 4'-kinase [Moraxella sp. K1630]MBE9590444.1 tetraacyldisaccharide 4'-kinase [Moraxella sp. K127]MBE9595334.1 tetraacyldisaccharide 4'-kinase [Moraxella sp. K2450]MDH9217693.1 tetraacyldisaccharide 4'-kinase [Moraxella lacunata]